MMLARYGMMMPLLRCRAISWHDYGLCCDAGQLYNCVSNCVYAAVQLALVAMQGNRPPRLLAPRVIHCRGIATVPAGTACDGNTAKTTHSTTHVFAMLLHALAMLLPCPCYVRAMYCHYVAMLLSCCCHDHAIVMLVTCYCHAVAMTLPCDCHALVMILSCYCHVIIAMHCCHMIAMMLLFAIIAMLVSCSCHALAMI
jgi:hypothetical protein